MTGTGSGPTGASCSDWEWVGIECPNEDCETYRNCATCTVDFCGWCPASNTCLSASGLGRPDEGECEGVFAEWGDECVYGAGPCTEYDNCADCAEDIECGWCPGTGRCMPVDFDDEPVLGSCEGILTFGDACPASCISDTATACTPGADVTCCDGMECRQTSFSSGTDQCCMEAGGDCLESEDCCGTMQCGDANTCECRDVNRVCLDDGDCCLGVCFDGLCQ